MFHASALSHISLRLSSQMWPLYMDREVVEIVEDALANVFVQLALGLHQLGHAPASVKS